jgi:ribosomal protein L16 Arg81 hydroxylase
MNLSEILSYVPEKEFFDRYWEQKPLFVDAGRKGFFRDILSMESMNDILTNHRFRTDECKVSKKGKIVSKSLYRNDYSMRIMEREINDTVDTRKLLSLYAQGSTLVFAELNTRWFPIQQLKQEIENTFHATVLTNVFLTQKRAQGFSAHYDSHDVIVLQLSGSKLWKVSSSPIELPLKSQAFGRYLSNNPVDKAFDTLFEIELNEGDVLYLPRGYMHEAKTLDEPSLHLTLGLHPKLAVDFIIDAMTLAGHHSSEIRRSLPNDFLNQPTNIKRSMLESWVNLAIGSLSNESVESICLGYKKRIAGLTKFCTPDHLMMINASPELEATSNLISEQASDIVLDEGDGLLSLHRGKQKLAIFPTSYKTSVEYILNNHTYSFHDIPGQISDEAKKHLIEKLKNNGVVYVL